MQPLNFDLLQDIATTDSLGMWHVEASTLFGNLGFGPSAWPESFQMFAFGRSITIFRAKQIICDGELRSVRYSSQGNGYLEFEVWND